MNTTKTKIIRALILGSMDADEALAMEKHIDESIYEMMDALEQSI